VLRLVPDGTSSPLPIVVDHVMSRRLDLHRGDPVAVSIDARQLPARVVSVVDRLPGAQTLPVVGVDLGTFERALLASTMFLPSADSIWMRSHDEQAVVPAVQRVLPPTSTLVTASSRSVRSVVAPASVALWMGAAGTLLLVLMGIGCVVASAAAARREELVVLRAVGVDAVRQGRWRAAELVCVVIAGTLLGFILGWVVTVLTVPDLAESTLVDDVMGPSQVVLAAGALALSVGSVVALALLGAVVHGRRTRRDALVSTPGEVRP
jgi:hypothetical protein